MKTLIVSGIIGLAVALAPTAAAGPAMCNDHTDHGGQWGMPPGSKYVTACGGDSGPDAPGNNATAPRVNTTPSN